MAGLLGHVGSNIREGCVSEDLKFVDKGFTTKEIMELTVDLGVEDLRILNKDIVKRIKMLMSIEDLKAASTFSVGEDVFFISKKYGKIKGKVTKINRKTIGVKCTDIIGRGEWRVSPTILKRVADKVADEVSQYPNLKYHEDMR